MDSGTGRETTFPTARLALIVGLIGLLVLLREGYGGGARASAGGPAPGVSAALGGRAPALPGVPAAERAAREARIERVIGKWVEEARSRSHGEANGSSVAVAVHAIELGEKRTGLLAARLPDMSMRPASNMKLVTTAAALTLLSSGFAFETRVEAGGPISDGVLHGDLVLRASGDPLCDAEGDGRNEARLDAVVEALRESGVRLIDGDVVLDEGAFADPSPAPGWPEASQHWAEYCALAGGFSVNGGVLRATLLPGSGAGRGVEVRPAPHGLREKYGVKIGSRSDVRVGATATTCTVKGELPAAQVEQWSAAFSHPDPVGLFGAVLSDRLQRGGVEVGGAVKRRRGTPPGVLLGSVSSPLVDTLVPINTRSANSIADHVFLAMGAAAVGEGSRAGGQQAARKALGLLGVPQEGFVQVDGSGLSRDNRVTARQIVALLEAVHRLPDEVRELFFSSLAVAGRTGTLRERMRGTAGDGRVHGKTGWIAGASALSGLARGEGGREVLFSILVGYPSEASGLNTHVFKPMQDELVLVLLEDSP